MSQTKGWKQAELDRLDRLAVAAWQDNDPLLATWYCILIDRIG